MKKLLITGFEPFGGETTNPSWDALANIPDTVGDYQLTKLEIPVVFGVSAETVIRKAEEIEADVVLCIGQAGGRDAITPELVGINLRHGSIPDNDGNQPCDDEIVASGDKAYFTTIPSRRIAEAIAAKGINARLSYTAGAYVCNDVIYSLLHRFSGTDTKFGFIHVPYSTNQGKEPSMPLEKITEAILIAIENL